MDGIIIINKEQGYTSNDVVQIIKKKFNEKVGHTGTLDPMATGVLPILVGKGTLLSKYLINHDKIYVATLKLGIKTDTGDITGDIIEKIDFDKKCLEEENVRKALEDIRGEQEQIPPMYSAIKVNGKKLYEYARKGLTIDISPRKIKIYNTEVLNIDKENNEIQFKVSCSKGTYIRALCESIAEKLGTIGTMNFLNREKVGDFEISEAIKLSEIKENFNEDKLILIEKFFQDKDEILLSPRSFVAFINGVKLMADNIDGVYRIYNSNKEFVGIGIVKNGILKRDIVI
ncbi:MAG: tRNA pseudouridine(55) synthase TruB [Clostridia bacterium]|nr:tRNA pseudouridine(55) synthase TruB [Clostridia bacterium]